MYIKNPIEIEFKSMSIIDGCMEETCFSQEETIVAKRMIHTTGDLDYRHIIVFKNDFINIAKDAIKKGGDIYVDTKMAYMGINKKALSKTN